MKKIIFIIFLISVFFSCSKLEEGPAFSFKTKRERINNTWVVNKFISSGVDSTDYFKDNWFDQIYFEKIDIFGTSANYIATINDSVIFEASYNILSHDKKRYLSFFEGSGYQYPQMYPFVNMTGGLIMRLTKDEFIIEYIEYSTYWNRKVNFRLDLVAKK